MKQALKLEAIGHMQRAADRSMLWIAARFGFLDDIPRVRNPWVARIIAVDPAGGFKREFIKPHVDYSEANSKGSRGVFYYFAVEEGHVYEVFERVTWQCSDRYFVYPNLGRLQRLSRDEVIRWLAR